MKHNDYIRKIDALGRLALPIEMRSELGLRENASLRLELEDGKITIVPFVPQRVPCGIGVDPIASNSAMICQDCAEDGMAKRQRVKVGQ